MRLSEGKKAQEGKKEKREKWEKKKGERKREIGKGRQRTNGETSREKGIGKGRGRGGSEKKGDGIGREVDRRGRREFKKEDVKGKGINIGLTVAGEWNLESVRW